jgi:single-stranded DNA-binding protein
VFSIRTARDTYVGSVIMETHSRSRTSAEAALVTKGRVVAIDGELTQHEYLSPDGRNQTRTAIRADRLQVIDQGPADETGRPHEQSSRAADLERGRRARSGALHLALPDLALIAGGHPKGPDLIFSVRVT